MFHYRSASACGGRIGGSDRCDHSPNRPTRGRRNAADYERRNAFLVFITNAADAPADYEPTY